MRLAKSSSFTVPFELTMSSQVYTKVDWSLDYRKQPEKYVIGKGEFGVLKYEPYKSEILPYWKFKNENVAKKSCEQIHNLFNKYCDEKDFVGMDMARKYFQMGWTRSMRYAKYKGGRKYNKDGTAIEPIYYYDKEKYKVSRIFKHALDTVKQNEIYQDLLHQHKQN